MVRVAMRGGGGGGGDGEKGLLRGEAQRVSIRGHAVTVFRGEIL